MEIYRSYRWKGSNFSSKVLRDDGGFDNVTGDRLYGSQFLQRIR